MQRAGNKAALAVAGLVSLFGASSLAARQDTQPAAPAVVKVTVEGPILTTPAGMTLYAAGNEDSRNPKFTWQCTDKVWRTTNDQQSGIGERPQIGFKLLKSCIDKFPPYIAAADARPTGNFTIVSRPDGTKQWAYSGFPLYTSTKDRAPGDHNGMGGGFLGLGGGSPTIAGAAPRFGGMRLAWAPTDLPPGLKASRMSEGLILVSADTERPIYTPRGNGRLIKASAGREDFKPLAAPAIGRVSGDWSIVDNGSGQKQYAFRGKPLFRAPASLNQLEVAGARGWETVIVEKAPALPSAIGQHLTLTGDVFTDKNGMTLYRYSCVSGLFEGHPVSCDDAGDPAAFMVALCGDGTECARRWHPYVAARGAKPEGEFSIIDITYPMFTDMRGKLYPSDAPRVKAWAYKGAPLFTYYEDEKPGDIWGNSIGGIWGSSWSVASVPGKAATYFEP